MSGILYLTGTPIGNLEDITLRQLRILREVDFIAAEDTRVTRKLLSHYDIHTPLVSCHEHTPHAQVEAIAERIAAGETCAEVTDAGMPCLSDPGAALAACCRAMGIRVEAVPGPSAAVTALAVSGANTEAFSFYGFLPAKAISRADVLQEIAGETKTVIVYEAPHRLLKTLSELMRALGGERMVSLCRELTKIHEEVRRLTLAQAVALYENEEPRGEFVLVIDGAKRQAEALSPEEALSEARQAVAEGMPPTEAAKRAAKVSGLSRQEVYRRLTEKKTGDAAKEN